jgi:hypothetical protein
MKMKKELNLAVNCYSFSVSTIQEDTTSGKVVRIIDCGKSNGKIKPELGEHSYEMRLSQVKLQR